MDNITTSTPDLSGLPEIIGTLEQQLAELDGLALQIAAAHLDAAIRQLRLDRLRDDTI